MDACIAGSDVLHISLYASRHNSVKHHQHCYFHGIYNCNHNVVQCSMNAVMVDL